MVLQRWNPSWLDLYCHKRRLRVVPLESDNFLPYYMTLFTSRKVLWRHGRDLRGERSCGDKMSQACCKWEENESLISLLPATTSLMCLYFLVISAHHGNAARITSSPGSISPDQHASPHPSWPPPSRIPRYAERLKTGPGMARATE